MIKIEANACFDPNIFDVSETVTSCSNQCVVSKI